MKKLFLAIIGILFIASCNVLWDVDTTDHVSMVSCKPDIKLLGDPMISFPVGSTYTEEGVEAFACDTPLTYTIVSGQVNPKEAGLYQVVYKATNGFGWSSYAYRTVLVYNGDPYITDIGGDYRIGFLYHSTITKHSVKGFWQMSQAIDDPNKDYPVVLVEDPNNVGHFIVVPGVWEDLGRYKGSAEYIPSPTHPQLKLTITFIDQALTKTYTWKK